MVSFLNKKLQLASAVEVKVKISTGAGVSSIEYLMVYSLSKVWTPALVKNFIVALRVPSDNLERLSLISIWANPLVPGRY